MEHDYKNIISHIDIDRTLDGINHFAFNGIKDSQVQDFKNDIESGNDSIELHLVKSNAYKEALILRLKKSDAVYSGESWKELLKEEQKTFGGSKIFYIDSGCTKLLILALPDEIKTKVNMLVTRLNKINEKISRLNSKIRKDNLDVYTAKAKNKEATDKEKDEIINFINQNLKV
ncbi:hypothetical protein HY637_00580 [Candidatus Woesearchaeota archaeon]|nr:hypothetical protein [Candidatus Woesearchaeota archaeon]